MRRRTLYYGDNIDILRDMPTESIDLVYLDPPFNSNADYNVIFREHSDSEGSGAQIHAFEDTWQWGNEAAKALNDLVMVHGELAEHLDFTVRRLGHNSLSAYLVMMAPRLVEMNRVLKPTGSLYLHCDPTAGHYLKIMLDVVFGADKFRSEIVWKRSSAHNDTKQGRKMHGHIHDLILFYSKGNEWTWNPVYTPYEEQYATQEYRRVDPSGRRYKETDLTAAKPGGDVSYEWRVLRRGPTERWQADLDEEWKSPRPGTEYLAVRPYRGRFWAYSKSNLEAFARSGKLIHRSTGMPRLVQYADEMQGVPLQDVWTDIPPISGQAAERLGYPTQKPVALLERIIQSSSDPGDVVLDPFCGCGTAIAAAEKLGRSWIGIDITHLAVGLIAARLKRDFDLNANKDFDVIGTPKDLGGARALFEQEPDGPYQFQFWINGVIGAQSYGAGATGKGKKGGDGGIDGKMYFRTPGGEKLETLIVSVKGGEQLTPAMIRELESVVGREKAAMGVFVSLRDPTAGMRQEAAKYGFYHYGNQEFPRIQVLTVAEILEGKRPAMPAGAANVSLESKAQKSLKTDKRSEAMRGLFEEARE